MTWSAYVKHFVLTLHGFILWNRIWMNVCIKWLTTTGCASQELKTCHYVEWQRRRDRSTWACYFRKHTQKKNNTVIKVQSMKPNELNLPRKKLNVYEISALFFSSSLLVEGWESGLKYLSTMSGRRKKNLHITIFSWVMENWKKCTT